MIDTVGKKPISENPALNMTRPSEFLEGRKAPGESYYLKSGSWSTDRSFDMWEYEPDNALLNRLCGEADDRGWTPLPEHRIFCFDRAREVISRFA